MFKMTADKLKELIVELDNFKRDKNTLYISYVNDRLNKSLQTYYNELRNAYVHELANNNVLRKPNNDRYTR